MGVEDVLVCTLCRRPPDGIKKFANVLTKNLEFTVTCHGLVYWIAVGFDEVSKGMCDINGTVQSRFNGAVAESNKLPRVSPLKVEVTEAPLVVTKPQRKIDLE